VSFTLCLYQFEAHCTGKVFFKCYKMAPPEVTIEQGKLRGSTGTNLRGETFLKFQGIPYAKPPLGELSLLNLPKSGAECSMPPKKEIIVTPVTCTDQNSSWEARIV
jgi:hypothetical protein